MSDVKIRIISKDMLFFMLFLQVLSYFIIAVIGYYFNFIYIALMFILLAFVLFVSLLYLIKLTNDTLEDNFVKLYDKYESILTNQKIIFDKQLNRKNEKK